MYGLIAAEVLQKIAGTTSRIGVTSLDEDFDKDMAKIIAYGVQDNIHRIMSPRVTFAR